MTTKERAKPDRFNARMFAALTATALLAMTTMAAIATAETGACTVDDQYVLPAGGTLLVAEDLAIERSCGIRIEGDIIANAGTGATIRLMTPGTLTIIGRVMAGSGANGIDIYGNRSALAGPGSPGGSVVMEGGSASSLFLATGAVIAAGAGGNGGSALVSATDAAAYGCTCAEGGAGGPGGSIAISTGKMEILGTLIAGNGGIGGVGIARGPNVAASGGDGGPSGTILLDGAELADLSSITTAGQGGLGGDAIAESTLNDEIPPPQLFGENGDPRTNECQSAALLTILLGDNVPESFRSAGPDATAIGGSGGPGIIRGGDGGKAMARACDITDPGTTGANGEDGQCNLTPCSTPSSHNFAPTNGETGSKGFKGGTATARGGHGGPGGIEGGNGAAASAAGGDGGIGGTGGKGGDAVLPCIEGADGGQGGDGGDGGDGYAYGGDAGGLLSDQGFPVGSNGIRYMDNLVMIRSADNLAAMKAATLILGPLDGGQPGKGAATFGAGNGVGTGGQGGEGGSGEWSPIDGIACLPKKNGDPGTVGTNPGMPGQALAEDGNPA